MNRVVKTTIASALVLSMALGGTTAAMAAAPAEEENCISAASELGRKYQNQTVQ